VLSAASKHAILAIVSVALIAILAGPGGATGGREGKRDGWRDRVAPTAPANVRVTAATSTTASLAWNPSTDNVGVKGYYVYFNGRRVTVSGTTYTARSLYCGVTVAVWIVAYDRAGNRSVPTGTNVSTAACPDTQPPTPPTGLRQAATAQDAVVLAWDASTDNVGVVGYRVYRDGLPVASGVEPTVTLPGLFCGTTYEYAVDAVDAAGNRSARSAVWVSTADCADEEPPSAPTELTVTDRTASSLTLVWSSSSDNVGVAGYSLSLDGVSDAAESLDNEPLAILGLVGEASQPSATLSDLDCGTTYAIAVEAYDAVGNRSPAATVNAATEDCPTPPPVDTTPPSAPTGLAVATATPTTVALTWLASTDNVGVQGYGVYRDGAAVSTVSVLASIVSNLTCGTAYTFAVDAYDAAGNRSPRASVTASTSACTDTQSPSLPGNLTVTTRTATSIALSWSASSDNVGVTGYGLYRGGSQVGTATALTATFSGLTCDTSYTLSVDAFDAAGNRSPRASVTASTSACTDTQPPSLPGNLTVATRTATSIALSWSASSDNVGVTGYGLYRGGSQVGTAAVTTATFSGLTCNTNYTLSVDAYDAAGNRSPHASVTASTSACADTQSPTLPANLTATSRTTTSIALSWSASSDNVGVTGYGLYQGGAQVGTTTGTTGIFPGLTCNTNYTLAVDAYDAAGNRSAKAIVMVATTACPDTTAPSTPTGLAASNVTQTGLTLTWNASTDNVGTVAYDVYRDGALTSSVASTSSAQAGLACGTSYWFAVEARDAAGNRSAKAQVNPMSAACPPPEPPPASNRYTDIDFAAGKYAGEGVVDVFEAYQSDPRLSDWGGLPSDLYDSRGLTQEQGQRVHLTHTPTPPRPSSTWGSWQELRSTDGPWAVGLNLAKASLNVSKAATWGPDSFSMGDERWFAFDYLLPLNVGGVSFEFVNGWHVLADLHAAGTSPWRVESAIRPQSGHPRYHAFLATPNTGTTPYREVNLLQLTNADGSRVTSAYNVWHELVVGIKASDQGSVGNSPGWVEVWHDGVNVMPRESRPTVGVGESGPYAQLQNYTAYPTAFAGGATRGAVVYGGLRAGLMRADVQTR
jgi:chitodextrinase